MFDRIDLHIDVPAVSPNDLSLPPPAEDSAKIASRVIAARQIQLARYKKLGETIRTNSEVEGELLEKVAAPEAAGRDLLTQAAEKMHLSARGYHRILKVARTLADLEGSTPVLKRHVAEALGYRRVAPSARS